MVKRKSTYTKGPKAIKKQKRKSTPKYRKFLDDVELKVNDTGPAQFQANSTGQFTLLMAPTPGSDITNRVGRKTVSKSIYIRGIVSAELPDQDGPTVGASPAQLARMIVFVDMQPNAAAPAVTDILTAATSVAQLNLNNRDRFIILRDKQFNLNAYAYNVTAQTAVASLSNSHCVKEYIPLNVETIFNAGTTGTVADITSGALYMFWIGNRAAGGDDVTCALSSRVRYADA